MVRWPRLSFYDIFLSHSSRDKSAVRELAERLRTDGLSVWFDEWIIKPGDLIGLAIERRLEQSRTLILVMSANAFFSEWATLERQSLFSEIPNNTLHDGLYHYFLMTPLPRHTEAICIC